MCYRHNPKIKKSSDHHNSSGDFYFSMSCFQKGCQNFFYYVKTLRISLEIFVPQSKTNANTILEMLASASLLVHEKHIMVARSSLSVLSNWLARQTVNLVSMEHVGSNPTALTLSKSCCVFLYSTIV